MCGETHYIGYAVYVGHNGWGNVVRGMGCVVRSVGGIGCAGMGGYVGGIWVCGGRYRVRYAGVCGGRYGVCDRRYKGYVIHVHG